MQADYHKISQKRLDVQRSRIDACDTLLDYIHDDIPHRDQQPLLDLLRKLKGNLEDDMSAEINEDHVRRISQ